MGETVQALWVLFLGFFLYFLPAIAANRRRHRNESAIMLLNLLTGWTGIGWVAALVWSQTADVREPLPPPAPRKSAATGFCTQCGAGLAGKFCSQCGASSDVKSPSV